MQAVSKAIQQGLNRNHRRSYMIGAICEAICKNFEKKRFNINSLRQKRPFTENRGDDRELAFDLFLSDKKARQCRADIGVARRIGAGAAASEGRAGRRK
jgi:hypothetical protein